MCGRIFNFFCCCSTPNYEEPDYDHEEGFERTLVVLHGDVMSRNLLGQVISELEKDFAIVGMKMIQFDRATVDKLYRGAKHADFYPSLVQYMTTGPHVVLVVEGENAIERMLALKGKSPEADEENTLRKKFGINIGISSIHCSHHYVDAAREIRLFFKTMEILDTAPDIEEYLRINPNP